MEGTSTPASLQRGVLECNICLAPPTNPVVTPCDHLFCWPCLYRWLQEQPKPCPVCRVMLRKDVNIPIYGNHEEDSKEVEHSGAIPPRPNPPSTAMAARGSHGAITRWRDAGRVRILSQLSDHINRDREELWLALQVERAHVNALEAEIQCLRTTVADLARLTCELEVNETVRREQAHLDFMRAYYAPHQSL